MNQPSDNQTPEPAISIPRDLLDALNVDHAANTQWSDLTSISRRDFISWIESAKQASTRARRVQVACSKLAAGQRRPCCYAVIPMGLYRALDTNLEAKANWKSLSPMQRRDIADWIENSSQIKLKAERIEKACAILASGRQLDSKIFK